MNVTSSNKNILIVEDEWVIALDIKRRLNKLGYGITGIAKNAETALHLAQTSRPDLVLMDIHLQGAIDGTQIAIKMREQFHLPVVFLTAHADEATLNRAVAAHPFGYIVKPFEDHNLSTTIEIALANYRAETMMQQAMEKERALNELKSQFVSIVSHEFRNPLGSIIALFDLLELRDAQLTSAQRLFHFQRGRMIAKEMAQLIDDILVVGEVDRDQFQCQTMPIDISWFCHSLVEDLESVTEGSHQLVFTVHEHQGTERPIYQIDSKLLQHILNNLLSNAIKYSSPGSQVRFEVNCQPETIIFQIQDQGIGIPARDQAHLFTPFHRGTNVRNVPGTGLGLSIVKRCVDAHGGRIAVDSQVGEGTTFTVTLENCCQVNS